MLQDIQMNKYEAFLKHGILYALNLDSGEVFQVEMEGLKIFSSLDDEDCPYEIYEEDGQLYCINTDNGAVREAVLVKHE
jgi:hypothetical protein